MKVAIIRFPGTNCEFDTQYAFEKLGVKAQIIWHEEKEIDADLVVLPGGFSYGDYLRCAAIAKIAPAMQGVIAHAKRGGYILGICNGFQILLESGLLEGAMKHNNNLSFISKNQNLRVVSNDNVFLKNFQKDEIINHLLKRRSDKLIHYQGKNIYHVGFPYQKATTYQGKVFQKENGLTRV